MYACVGVDLHVCVELRGLQRGRSSPPPRGGEADQVMVEKAETRGVTKSLCLAEVF